MRKEHNWRRRVLAAAVAVVLVAETGSVAMAQNPPTDRPTAGAVRTVTLITGDKVILNGSSIVQLVPGDGRSKIPFRSHVDKGHLHVVPNDAAPLLASGKLDRRLFDVTSLADSGYDDSKRSTVPVIVQPGGNGVGAMDVRDRLGELGLVTATVPKSGSAWQSLRSGATGKIWLDGKRQVSLDRSTRQIGAPQAWQAGVTGKGVKVAVIDTGVDEKHPDLQGKQVAEKNFTGAPDATDDVGHGTHVAATIASKDERYRGVAPDAQILDAKVCTQDGCSESAILAAMQWAADQGADVVNLSLGGADTPEIDPIEDAVNRLSRDTGALFVVAAGNSGPGKGTVGSPASADSALAVGAVDRQDGIASFSSRGPAKDGGLKPDVTAPGTDIVAALAGTQSQVALSGTSMATPHVAGAAALLKQQHPGWTGQQIKSALVASAKPNERSTLTDQGTGRVDVPAALAQNVITEPANVNLGLQEWPHDDDKKTVRDITYRNTGPSPVTLDLTLNMAGPGGKAPAGMFSLAPSTLTIPAGGTAKAVLTADTTVPAPDGYYTGTVTANGALRIPVGLTREPESYPVRFSAVAKSGQPTGTHNGFLVIDVRSGESYDVAESARLPKGEYRVSALVGDGTEEWSAMSQPRLVVNGPKNITFDARTTKPITLGVPGPVQRRYLGWVMFTGDVAGSPETVAYGSFGGITGAMWVGQVGEGTPDTRTAFMEDVIGTPRDDRTSVNYRLYWQAAAGNVPTGYERNARQSELAEMKTGFRTSVGAERTLIGAFPRPDDRSQVAYSGVIPVPEGNQVVDLVTAEGVRWGWTMTEVTATGEVKSNHISPVRRLRPGKAYQQTLGTAVFGPSINADVNKGIFRRGDDITSDVAMRADSRGGGGFVQSEKRKTELFRDGEKIGENDRIESTFRVPAGDGRYRLRTEMSQNDTDLSTKVRADWTFGSAHSGGDRTMLPITSVLFQPKLSSTNSTRDEVLRVPLKFEQQTGTPRVRSVEVEASFDDGVTWRKVPVVAGVAIVRNADGAKYGSLRAKTVDTAGNNAEVTVIHAYRIDNA